MIGPQLSLWTKLRENVIMNSWVVRAHYCQWTCPSFWTGLKFNSDSFNWCSQFLGNAKTWHHRVVKPQTYFQTYRFYAHCATTAWAPEAFAAHMTRRLWLAISEDEFKQSASGKVKRARNYSPVYVAGMERTFRISIRSWCTSHLNVPRVLSEHSQMSPTCLCRCTSGYTRLTWSSNSRAPTESGVQYFYARFRNLATVHSKKEITLYEGGSGLKHEESDKINYIFGNHSEERREFSMLIVNEVKLQLQGYVWVLEKKIGKQKRWVHTCVFSAVETATTSVVNVSIWYAFTASAFTKQNAVLTTGKTLRNSFEEKLSLSLGNQINGKKRFKSYS